LLCLVAGILDLITGEFIIGIISLFLSAVNLYIFMLAVKRWWDASDKVKTTFVFNCPQCKERHIPSFWTWFLVPHVFSLRYLKCPKCKSWHWMKRK
jgi:hypothetical protein